MKTFQFSLVQGSIRKEAGLLTCGNNTQIDVFLQDLARGAENITTSFCLLLANSWRCQSLETSVTGQLEESIMGAFLNALQCKVSQVTQTTVTMLC